MGYQVGDKSLAEESKSHEDYTLSVATVPAGIMLAVSIMNNVS